MSSTATPVRVNQSSYDSLEYLRTTLDNMLRNGRGPGETAQDHFRRIFIESVQGNVSNIGTLLMQQLCKFSVVTLTPDCIEDMGHIPPDSLEIWDATNTEPQQARNGDWIGVLRLRPLQEIVNHPRFVGDTNDFLDHLFYSWRKFELPNGDLEGSLYDSWAEELGFDIA